MTKEEAIKYLIKPVATSTEIGEEKQKEFEAYNMAIKDLQENSIPPACRNCSNHPKNGGSGICHCILGGIKING